MLNQTHLLLSIFVFSVSGSALTREDHAWSNVIKADARSNWAGSIHNSTWGYFQESLVKMTAQTSKASDTRRSTDGRPYVGTDGRAHARRDGRMDGWTGEDTISDGGDDNMSMDGRSKGTNGTFCPTPSLQLPPIPTTGGAPPRVLVIVICSTRAQGLVWPSFKRYLLDELDADLALAVSVTGGGPSVPVEDNMRRNAKYIWEIKDPPSNDFSFL